MLQFGANDNGGAKGKGALGETGEETAMNQDETVHTFCWHLKQFVAGTGAQGGTPIIGSLTPRKNWSPAGIRFMRKTEKQATWAEQVAAETQTTFIPHHEIIAAKYDTLGVENVDAFYGPSPKEKLHTGWDGSVINADCVVSGLKALPADLLAACRAPHIPPAKPGASK